MRKSFSLIITMAFIVVMSVIGYMILKFNAASNVHTTRSFMDTRAELMLRSATEYAILALQGHDFKKNGCIKSLNINDSGNLFNVKVRYHYFLTNCNPSVCDCSPIKTDDTNGTVLIYVTVTSKNKNFNIRKVRFTLQNP